MEDKVKYGLALLAAGSLVLFVAGQLDSVNGMGVGAAIVVAGGFLLHLAWRKWYCAQCGQFLGRGERPRRCDRCGSNRVTNEDPGPGDTVKVRRK